MRRSAIALLLFALASCQSSPIPVLESNPTDNSILTEVRRFDLSAELKTQRELWEKTKPDHYKYTISQFCVCLDDYDFGPNEIEVKNGEIVRRTYRGERQNHIRKGEPLPKGRGVSYSIEDMFDRIDGVLAREIKMSKYTYQNAKINFTVKYDDVRGFPSMISHSSSNLANESSLLFIKNFEPL